MARFSLLTRRHLPVAGVCAAMALLLVSPLGSTRAVAQRGAQRGAAPAAGPPLQVSLAGVRVVGPGAGENGSELRAFNESPGTALALFVKAPAGSGIVEIDDDESKLDAFTDDKGQTMLEEGRVGPFPKVSNDGTVGLFEVEVRARPSAGALAVTAQGSVSVLLSGGAKPTRIANVRLEPARTMRLGTATITVKEVTAGDESTTLTLALTRTVLKTIRNVRFFDAKGAAIEGRRTGSGYMNESAEMSFDVKTKEKVVSVEFDVWQNLRTVKAPFSIKASLGLDR